MKRIWVKPVTLQPPGNKRQPVKNPLSLKSRALIPLLLFILVIPGCARMELRVQEQAAFKVEMSSGQITESRLYWHAARDNIDARKESSSTIKVGENSIRISLWKVWSYPTSKDVSFITFYDGKYQSIYSVPDPMKVIGRRY